MNLVGCDPVSNNWSPHQPLPWQRGKHHNNMPARPYLQLYGSLPHSQHRAVLLCAPVGHVRCLLLSVRSSVCHWSVTSISASLASSSHTDKNTAAGNMWLCRATGNNSRRVPGMFLCFLSESFSLLHRAAESAALHRTLGVQGHLLLLLRHECDAALTGVNTSSWGVNTACVLSSLSLQHMAGNYW